MTKLYIPMYLEIEKQDRRTTIISELYSAVKNAKEPSAS